ncbi:MAG TPA: hypothetical protein VMJ64_05075 [Anaerolineales bacterium]|nr:hypothetical protein [Anaerolineales bacterium]
MKKAIPGALAALVFATLACSIFVGGPAYPDDAIPTATGTPMTLQQQLEEAVASVAQDGEVSVQITEQQLTDYLQAKAGEQANPVISDPRVYLRSGEMKVYGKAKSGIFNANVAITIQASIDADGQPHFDIAQTDFGPLKAPQGLNAAIAASIQEAFTGWLGPVATGFRMQSITIEDGVMTVTGRIK